MFDTYNNETGSSNNDLQEDDVANYSNRDVGTTSAPSEASGDESSGFEWTTAKIVQSIVLFGFAGVGEIVGGWMIWMAYRGNSQGKKPAWFAVVGSIVLVIYGFIPLLQPPDSFGRVYAAYGGFFIVMSFLFGWALDGDRPDLGDIVGGSVSLAGVLIVLFWPR